jgi:hypothetical protein
MTYPMIPVSLRYPVLARRVHMLYRRIEPLVNQPLPAGEPPLQDLLLSLNKILLACDDAAIAADSVIEHDPHLVHSVEELLETCRRAPQRVQPRMRSILRRLAEVETRDGSPGKADFYAALANSTAFEGTGLHHPILRV